MADGWQLTQHQTSDNINMLSSLLCAPLLPCLSSPPLFTLLWLWYVVLVSPKERENHSEVLWGGRDEVDSGHASQTIFRMRAGSGRSCSTTTSGVQYTEGWCSWICVWQWKNAHHTNVWCNLRGMYVEVCWYLGLGCMYLWISSILLLILSLAPAIIHHLSHLSSHHPPPLPPFLPTTPVKNLSLCCLNTSTITRACLNEDMDMVLSTIQDSYSSYHNYLGTNESE